MKTTVNISTEILDWLFEKLRMDILPGPIIDYLESWRSGEKTPTFNQIEKVSKATGVPLGYFFLQSPPKEDVSFVEYRTLDSVQLMNPSRNLIETMHDMDQIQEWMRNHLIAEHASKLAFIGSLKDETNIGDFAARVRGFLGVTIDWYKGTRSAEASFNFIRNAISSSGVIVMMNGIVGNNTHRTLDIEEFRAFAVVDEYAPLIFINSNDSANGKLFSLLHEFAHICIGENSLFNDRYSTGTGVKKAEVICNAVAAEIMVPTHAFIDAWKSEECTSEEKAEIIENLAHYFKCGITVIARKAYDNKFIDYSLYREIAEKAVRLYNEIRKRKKENNDGGGNFYRTAASRIDRRFFGMLLTSVHEGKTLHSDAFRLTNTNRTTFGTLAENVGGGIK